MKILYVSQFFKPERVAAAFRAYDNAKAWTEKGEEVTVLTGYPNFPTGKLFDGYKIKLLDEEKIDGIRVLRSKLIIKENTSKIKRIMNALSFLIYGTYNVVFNNKIIGNDFNVVLATSGTILAPIIGYIYSIKNKVPFILEIRDITYIQMLAVYNGKKNIIYKIVKKLELFLCKKASKVIVVTNGFKSELIKAGINKEKIEVIHNGVDTKEINVGRVSYTEEIVFSYMGNIGASQGIENIIKIFNALSLGEIKKKLIIIGDGAKKENIKQYIKDNKLKNIIVEDGMNQQELEKYYDISDLCIVSLNNTEFFKNTVPSKIFQIMGRGKCIVFFGPSGEASSIISTVDDTFIFTENNIEQIVDSLEAKIINKENLKSYLEEKGKEFRVLTEEKYDRNLLAEKYINILKECNKYDDIS